MDFTCNCGMDRSSQPGAGTARAAERCRRTQVLTNWNADRSHAARANSLKPHCRRMLATARSVDEPALHVLQQHLLNGWCRTARQELRNAVGRFRNRGSSHFYSPVALARMSAGFGVRRHAFARAGTRLRKPRKRRALPLHSESKRARPRQASNSGRICREGPPGPR